MPPSKRPSYLDKYQNNLQQTQPKQYASNGFPPGRPTSQDRRPTMVRNGVNPLYPPPQRQQQQDQQSRGNQRYTNGIPGTLPNNIGQSGSDLRLNEVTARRQSVMGRELPLRRSSNSGNMPHPFQQQQRSRPASHHDGRTMPYVFDLCFDLPHPGASKDAERARMVEPPDVSNRGVLAELYDPSAVSRLARFAFPEHDDQKHALDLQMRAASNPRHMRRGNGVTKDHLNKRDVYLVGFRSERHTFSLVLRDGVTKLYGHTLRYLPRHRNSKTRSDVGRRGVRALVVLTRAVGGDGFYTAVLKSLEAAMILGDAYCHESGNEDFAREKITKLLHSLHRLQIQKHSEVMVKLHRKQDGSIEYTDNSVMIPGVEINLRPGRFINDDFLPGDFIKLEMPQSLQAGFRPGASPDDFDAPVLPLLRCIGAANTIRIMTALMCERRVIFVSDNVSRLSKCVQAASSLLAQGQLTWRYNLVQILPPHLLGCLSANEPYIIGIVDDLMKNVDLLMSLSDVLCIHLDKNQFKSFGMANPTTAIPDVLAKSGSETVVHILHMDMLQVLKAEAKTWGTSEDAVEAIEPNPRKKKTKKPGNVDVDMAALFHRVMRGEALGDNKINDIESVDSSVVSEREYPRLDVTSGHLPRNCENQRLDAGGVTTFDVCENIRGEEGLRAALSFFFLVIHGNLGALLSQGSNGAFFLDRKKYLLHQMKEGVKESTPLFALCKHFSGSAMLEHHLSQRLEEFQNGRSLLMPRHRSLFSLCEKHLRVKKLEFSFSEIRNVVSQTTAHSPLRALVEKTELARARALALTSSQPFDGDVSQALTSLLHDCHECDDTLPQVMAVVWFRLDDRRSSSWKQPLLGLHLMKSLLIQGPTTTIAYALDGIEKIRRLRFYENTKSIENNEEIRQSAKIVWELLTDGARLFLRRKLVLADRAKLFELKVTNRWGSYLINKLPFETDFRKYHTLLRPHALTKPAFMKDNDNGFTSKELEVFRMSLAPREDMPISTSPINAAIELNRLKARDLNDHPQDRPSGLPSGNSQGPGLAPEPSRLTTQGPTGRRASGIGHAPDHRRSTVSSQMTGQRRTMENAERKFGGTPLPTGHDNPARPYGASSPLGPSTLEGPRTGPVNDAAPRQELQKPTGSSPPGGLPPHRNSVILNESQPSLVSGRQSMPAHRSSVIMSESQPRLLSGRQSMPPHRSSVIMNDSQPGLASGRQSMPPQRNSMIVNESQPSLLSGRQSMPPHRSSIIVNGSQPDLVSIRQSMVQQRKSMIVNGTQPSLQSRRQPTPQKRSSEVVNGNQPSLVSNQRRHSMPTVNHPPNASGSRARPPVPSVGVLPRQSVVPNGATRMSDGSSGQDRLPSKKVSPVDSGNLMMRRLDHGGSLPQQQRQSFSPQTSTLVQPSPMRRKVPRSF